MCRKGVRAKWRPTSPHVSRRCRHQRGYDVQDYIVVKLMAQAAEVWFTAGSQEKRQVASGGPTSAS